MELSEKESPFFSLILVVTDQNAHLLPLTLDSITHQTFGSLEIVLLDSRTKKMLPDFIEGYITHKKILCPLEGVPYYAMLNRGIELSSGKYLHFLAPGEFYLSRKSLHFMKEFTVVQNEPDLVYTGYILRHSLTPPQTFFQNIDKIDLKTGNLPSGLQSYWFCKEALLNVGNFNVRYETEGGFDLICRFFLDNSLKRIFMKRILTDYEYRLKPPQIIVRQLFEVILITYLHFGVSRAIFWRLAENHKRLARWGIQSAKTAIWKRNIA